MVASWMVELHLDQINRALLEESSEATSRSEAYTEALRTFLKDHVDILDVNVTVSLLASYGRMDDLMHYATYRQVSFTMSWSQGRLCARQGAKVRRCWRIFPITQISYSTILDFKYSNGISAPMTSSWWLWPQERI